MDNEAKKEQAAKKAWKDQKKIDRWTADETCKTFNKAAKEVKAIEIQWKKEKAALEKIKKAREREEKKIQKEADKAAKAADKALKMSNKKKPYTKDQDGVASQSKENLSMIEEEDSEIETT